MLAKPHSQMPARNQYILDEWFVGTACSLLDATLNAEDSIGRWQSQRIACVFHNTRGNAPMRMSVNAYTMLMVT